MLCLRWLLAVVLAYVCVPGFGSGCLNSSICNDVRNERKLLECIRLCLPQLQAGMPELSAGALVATDDDDDDNDDDDALLLGIILAALAEDRLSESGLGSHGAERRSYSMEHFRWGKPTGRKRRPVKVFASSLEGGGSSEGGFPPQARRQLSSTEEAGSARSKVGSKPAAPSSPQDRKDGTYRMSHFRWGAPSASKRNGILLREKPKGQLAKMFRNILLKDVRRIIG